MNNLLNYIDVYELDEVGGTFAYIPLHTRDEQKARAFCERYFVTHQLNYFYTACSDYQWFGGWCYRLNKSNDGTMWLVRHSDIYAEV